MEENTQKVEAMEPKKMSYEELENVARQLSEQTRQLYTKLQEMNMASTQEIQELLTIPEETKEEKTEE